MGKTKKGRGSKGRGGRVGGGGGGGRGRGRGRGRGQSDESVLPGHGRARGHKDNNCPEGDHEGERKRKRHLVDDNKASNIDLKDAPKAVSRSAGVLGNEKIKKREINDKKDVEYGNDRASPENNDDIASKILQTLCKIQIKGRTQLGYLGEQLQLDGIKEFETSESLYSFLKNYDVFEVKEEPNRDAITNKDEVVKDIPEDRWDVFAQLYIHLCLAHSKNQDPAQGIAWVFTSAGISF